MGLIWLIIVISTLTVEALTYNLVTIWISLGAFVAYLISYITDNVQIQVITFLGVTIISLLSTRRLVRKFVDTKKIKTNLDDVVGKKGVVIKDILNDEIGRVKVMNKEWSAISDDNIKEGTKVEVLDIKGVKLVVKEEKK